MNTPARTVKDVLDLSEAYLAGRGVDQARLMAESLMARLLRRSRPALAMAYGQPVPESYLDAMRRGLKRVGDGEPLQYVLGETGFMDHVFIADPRALVPRPETECLVRRVLDCGPLWRLDKPALADVGTGTGCIILSLAAVRPSGRYLALDISADALDLARENAARLKLQDRVIFAEGGLSDWVEPETLDAVISNPPYIPTAALERLPANVRDFEPRLALDGGASGLDVLTGVIEEAAIALKPGGFLFLEIGEDQGRAVKTRMQAAGFSDACILPDLNGRDRVAEARLDADG